MFTNTRFKTIIGVITLNHFLFNNRSVPLRKACARASGSCKTLKNSLQNVARVQFKGSIFIARAGV